MQPAHFRWPVKVPVPDDGKYKFVEVVCLFKWMSEADASALTHRDSKKTDQQLCEEIVLAVEGMTYEDGTPVPSSPELVQRFLAVNNAKPTCIGFWLGALNGLAAEKN